MKPQYFILQMAYPPDVPHPGWHFANDQQGYDTRAEAWKVAQTLSKGTLYCVTREDSPVYQMTVRLMELEID